MVLSRGGLEQFWFIRCYGWFLVPRSSSCRSRALVERMRCSSLIYLITSHVNGVYDNAEGKDEQGGIVFEVVRMVR